MEDIQECIFYDLWARFDYKTGVGNLAFILWNMNETENRLKLQAHSYGLKKYLHQFKLFQILMEKTYILFGCVEMCHRSSTNTMWDLKFPQDSKLKRNSLWHRCWQYSPTGKSLARHKNHLIQNKNKNLLIFSGLCTNTVAIVLSKNVSQKRIMNTR